MSSRSSENQVPCPVSLTGGRGTRSPSVSGTQLGHGGHGQVVPRVRAYRTATNASSPCSVERGWERSSAAHSGDGSSSRKEDVWTQTDVATELRIPYLSTGPALATSAVPHHRGRAVARRPLSATCRRAVGASYVGQNRGTTHRRPRTDYRQKARARETNSVTVERPSPNWVPDPEMSSQVAAKWVEIAPLVDRLMERLAEPREFPVRPGSALVGDDKASSPYQVSHAVMACVSAAVDHLHAAKTLAYDSGLLHLAAPATLARGVIENAATGLWIVTPASRDERVRRVLKWHSRNAHDQAGAGFAPPGRAKGHYLDKIAAVATRRGLEPATVRSGYQMLKVIRTVDMEHSDLGGIAIAWQLASGFAHGRPWAYLGALAQEEIGSPEPGVTDLRLTNDPVLAMYPILKGLFTVQRLLQVRERRAGIHRPLSS